MYQEQVNSRLDLLEADEDGFDFVRIDRSMEALSQALLPRPPITPKRQAVPPSKLHTKQRKIPEYFSWKRKIPDFPTEITLEIASHMHPLGLLNYSRTSKSHRRILLSKGSRMAWNSALAGIPDLPPCPPDMSQPKYAALVFDSYCFACGIEGAYAVDFALRVRFCEVCYSENVVEGTELFFSVPRQVRDVVVLLVPTANKLNFGRELHETITRLNPVDTTDEDFFYVPEVEAILKWLWPLPTAESLVRARTLLQQRVEYITQRQTAALLLAWNRIIEAISMDGWPALDAACNVIQLSSLIDKNKHLAASRPSLDVDDDSDDSDDEDEVWVRANAMRVLCCSSIPKSTAQAVEEEASRGNRDAISRHQRLQMRHNELEEWFQKAVCSHRSRSAYEHSKFPNVYDGGRLWRGLIDPDARHEITASTFPSTLADFDEKLEDYDFTVKYSLAALIHTPLKVRNGADKSPFRLYDTSTPVCLALPVAMFTCDMCDKSDKSVVLPWPNINAHWQIAHPRKSIWASNDTDLNISWWKEGARLVEKILNGFPDLGGKSLTELDQGVRTRKLYCSCGDPSLQHPEELTWARLVHHIFEHAVMDDASLVWSG